MSWIICRWFWFGIASVFILSLLQRFIFIFYSTFYWHLVHISCTQFSRAYGYVIPVVCFQRFGSFISINRHKSLSHFLSFTLLSLHLPLYLPNFLLSIRISTKLMILSPVSRAPSLLGRDNSALSVDFHSFLTHILPHSTEFIVQTCKEYFVSNIQMYGIDFIANLQLKINITIMK